MPSYHRPPTLAQALELRAHGNVSLTVLAGGTDVYPVRTHRAAWLEGYGRDVLDLSGIADLAGVVHGPEGTVIGALATWSDVAATDLPPAFEALKQAGRQVGGVQIQNRGTLAGNLCNASPAADGAPPLLALDAQVELASLRGRRRVALSEFLLGNRRTVLAADELLIAIHIPPQQGGAQSAFVKLGARSYLVISIASVAVNLACDAGGRVEAASIAVGACSAVPQRLRAAEARLVGEQLTTKLIATIGASDLSDLSPIDDVRATATYRGHAALVLVRRALTQFIAPSLEAAA